MDSNTAKEVLETSSCYECARGCQSPIACELDTCELKEATRIAIKAIEENEALKARCRIITNGVLCRKCAIDDCKERRDKCIILD